MNRTLLSTEWLNARSFIIVSLWHLLHNESVCDYWIIWNYLKIQPHKLLKNAIIFMLLMQFTIWISNWLLACFLQLFSHFLTSWKQLQNLNYGRIFVSCRNLAYAYTLIYFEAFLNCESNYYFTKIPVIIHNYKQLCSLDLEQKALYYSRYVPLWVESFNHFTQF